MQNEENTFEFEEDQELEKEIQKLLENEEFLSDIYEEDEEDSEDDDSDEDFLVDDDLE
jgi:hypothetical protein